MVNAGVGVALGATSSLSSNPVGGIQMTANIGTPQVGGYLHTDVGSIEQKFSLTGSDIKTALAEAGNALNSAGVAAVEAIAGPLDGSNIGF